MGVARELVILELASIGYLHRRMKPITSNGRNNEVFLVASNSLQLIPNSPENAKFVCYAASSMPNVGEFIRIGMRLKSEARC